MKKTFIFICLFLSVLALHAKAIQEDYRNAEEKARLSYAMGMIIASNYNLSTLGLELDYNAFSEGLKATIENGETQFSLQEATEIVETAYYNAMEKVAEENRQHEEEFLAANSRRPEVQVTPSGLQYEVFEEADGEKPASNSIVAVNYEGTFIDGTLFDKSEDEGTNIPLEIVIPGWTEGLMLMSVGSKYRIYIPSSLAYGKNGFQNVIPPYSTLIFTVELLEIINLDYSEEEF
jgi:FKBP-type peptidyl-prolyl cis-trans isomerase